MTTKNVMRSLLLGLAISAMGCSGASSGANPLIRGVENPPDRIVKGCNLAKQKCTRCHTIDQILAAEVGTPDAWRLYVHRMRLMPGAGIRAPEEPKIVQCLVFRSFGNEGLVALEEQGN